MQKYVDTFYRVAGRAFMYDKAGNEYTGEQLMLALVLHTTGESRTVEDEKYVGRLFDDPNQKERRGNPKKRSQKSGPKH